MSTTTSSTPSPDDAAAQLESGVQTLLSEADARQTAALNTLSFVQQARVSRVTRAASATTSSAVEAAKTAAARSAVAQQQASTPAPQVAAKGWALHGRVYDNNLKPLARYSVYLADSQKTYLSAYGVDYTDSTGYFLLTHDGVDANTGTSKSSAPSAAPELYLQVADRKAMPVYASATAFTPTLGAATYQVVTLTDGDTPIGNPPAQVRATVIPPAKKAKGGGAT
jgi:hypothetical protein